MELTAEDERKQVERMKAEAVPPTEQIVQEPVHESGSIVSAGTLHLQAPTTSDSDTPSPGASSQTLWTRTVRLTKRDVGLGMVVSGGGDQPLRVAEVQPGKPALLSGRCIRLIH